MIFAFAPFPHSALDLLVAFVLGGTIGIERQLRQRMAGLRTNVLVAVGRADVIIAHLQRNPDVVNATWTVSTDD